MKLLKQTLKAYTEETHGEEAAPLFVVNSAYATENGMNSQMALHFSVKSENGNTIPVSLPATWIPVDLTTRAHRDLIVKDPNFRDLIQKKRITIVAASVDSKRKEAGFVGALDAYKDQSVREEFNSIFSNSHMTGDVEEDTGIDEGVSISAGASSDAATEMTASFVAQSIVDRCNSEESSATVMRTIRQQSLSLSKADLKYIMNQASDSQVKSLCAEFLNAQD